VLGGTFDPIHLGHLRAAEAARECLSLESVFFVPARVPPHKGEPHAPALDRFAMVSLATSQNPAFVASDAELRREGPSYMARYAGRAARRAARGRAGPDRRERHLSGDRRLAGSRQAVGLVRGRRGRPAPGASAPAPGASPRVRPVEEPGLPVSASEVRRPAEGGPQRPLPGARVGCGLHRQAGSLPLKLPTFVKKAAQAAIDKKASDVVVLDLRRLDAFTDHFLLASAANQKQLVAIADAILFALRKEGLRPNHHEGYPRQEWILLDYDDFVVHLFTPKTRAYYALERLWGEADRAEVAV
jgi:ribosome-associated protein